MLYYIILLCLTAATYGKPTGKPDLTQSCVNMTWACHDLNVAKNCNKFPNCVQIWEKIKAPQDNNEICDICKDMVKQARDQLLSNETQEEMKEVFEGSCNLLPIKAVAAECRKVVDEIVPELIEMLASRMDPNMVCTVAGLCNNGKLTHLLSEQYIMSIPLMNPVSTKGDCDNCKNGMKFVTKALQLIPKSDVTNLLLHACVENFHGTITQCEDFMNEVGPIIYNFLKVVGPDTFCGQMKVCPSIQPLVQGVGDNMTCQFCEAMVQYLKNMVQTQTTKEEFNTALENFCTDLKEFSDQCKALVDEYFDQFYDFLVKNLDPAEVCGALGLCNGQIALVKTTPAKTIQVLSPHVDIFPAETISAKPLRPSMLRESNRAQSLMPGIKIQAATNTRENKYKKYLLEHNSAPHDSESNSVNEIEPQQLPLERILNPAIALGDPNSMNCEVCKAIVAYLEKEIKNPKEEDEIRKVLSEVCKIFPNEAMANQCRDFISTNLDYLVTLILHEANPDVLCSLMKACPNSDLAVNNFMPCAICKKVMQYLENELGNNKTEEAIREGLEKACGYLPKSWTEKCDAFVDKYTDMIVDLLVHEIAPDLVCAALGLCPMEPKVEGEVECEVCQYVLHYLQEKLMDNATEEDIKKAVDQVCNVMPKTLAENCNAFVDEFGNSLLVLLAQKLDPSVLCINLKICPSKSIYSHDTVASHSIKSLKMDTCSTCQMIVDYMDKLLENDDVDTEISKLIEKICNIIPMASRDQCASIIETYGPYVLQMIGQLSNSKEVCQAVDLCSRSTGHVQLLGGEKCTYGPTYWCQSSAHANACNAEPFCTQQVWKN